LKIAVIDKYPVKFSYEKYFNFDFTLLHLSEVKLEKVNKKDVTLIFDHTEYDYVILIGAEAAKFIGGISKVTEKYGALLDGKFICLLNPGMIHFKPEAKDLWDSLVKNLNANIAKGFKNADSLGDFIGIQDEDGANKYLRSVLEHPSTVVALDSETSDLNPRKGFLLGISMSTSASDGCYIDAMALNADNVDLLQQILNTKTIVMHNKKFDIKWFERHLGVSMPRGMHDTMGMHYILDETSGSHGLKQLAVKFTGYGNYEEPLEKFKKEYCKLHKLKEAEFSYSVIPFDIMYKYAAIDTAVCYALYEKFLPIIEANDKLSWAYYNLIVRGLDFLTRMEEVGVPFDKKRLEFSRIELDKHIEEAKLELYNDTKVIEFEQAQGDRFNPNSTPQLRKLLFDFLKLPNNGKLTDSGALSTDAEVLEELAEIHRVPKLILEYRKRTKLLNTYVEKVLENLDKDGRLRTGFHLTTTTSGRLSSSGALNMQQLPRSSALVKGSMAAPPGYRVVSQDLSNGEVWSAAALCGDKNLCDIFKTGDDLHASVAKKVFKLGDHLSVDEVKTQHKQARQAAKAIDN
jgi:DNA polymerase I-like protein with 3'-5' exonuclease and polymerase domains